MWRHCWHCSAASMCAPAGQKAFVMLSSLAQIAIQMMTPSIDVNIQWTDACLHHAPSGFTKLTVRTRAGVARLSRCGPKSHLSQ